MIKLEGIVKEYKVADSAVQALKGLNIAFRDAEFVSILGPSGCGKTTLLNIIGGLDHYTYGDLSIDGVSTKQYKDRDWDTYRNHRVGFVFQSYNLIPHQTVLENVELALNIAGFSKEERVAKAKIALDRVGLSEHYNKKPNQLSGGQCQRVAIARALVNDPEILLADEPTGALDTVTSVQIMDLIKEIANDTLVIMVTHNPELAEKYSTRIVKLLDGQIVDDSNPYNPRSKKEQVVKEKTTKKSKLGFWSAFKLSSKNLMSKFKRTLMVCLAGSIGIIGVASVLSVSTGTTTYINNMQEDMLSGNPIKVAEEAYDLSSMMSLMKTSDKEKVKKQIIEGYVNVDDLVADLAKRSKQASGLKIKNDITQLYIDYLNEMPKEYLASLGYNYGIDPSNNIYTDILLDGYGNQTMSLSSIKTLYTAILETTDFKQYSYLVSTLSEAFQPLPESKDFVLSQYNILTTGTKDYPTQSNEITLVVNKDDSISDLLLAQLGYYTQDEFLNIIYKATDNPRYDASKDKPRFSYQELLGKTFTYFSNDQVYTENASTITPFTYSAYKNAEWGSGTQLTITSILIPKENMNYGCLKTGFYYTSSFAKGYIQDNKNSKMVKFLTDNKSEAFTSQLVGQTETGITYKYNYELEGTKHENVTGFVGTIPTTMAMSGSKSYMLTKRNLGGKELPTLIDIYAVDFDTKHYVTAYLDKWNSDETLVIGGTSYTKEQRNNIQYTDNLAVAMNMVGDLTSIVTLALVAFTALALVVSTVMISIITYVSVIERIKEIGVIRSLGGRKKDVSRLFIAESLIIGGISGIIGLVISTVLSIVVNIVAGTTIATMTLPIIVIMLAVSIGLTLISGLLPAKSASKKDPVVALRTE